MTAHVHHNLIAEAAERLGRPRVSFEFFPPKTEALEDAILGVDPQARAAGSRASCRSPTAPAARRATARTAPSRASSTRRRSGPPRISPASAPAAPRSTRCCATIGTRACATSWRCAAIRRAASARPYRAASGRLRERRRAGGRRQARSASFDISVAVHPEKHPASATWDARDREFQDASSTPAPRAAFRNSSSTPTSSCASAIAWRAGVTAPIVPGIMPVTNVNGLRKMAAGCGASRAALAGAPVRRPRRRSRNAPPGRRCDDGATLRAARRRRRARISTSTRSTAPILPWRSAASSASREGGAGGMNRDERLAALNCRTGEAHPHPRRLDGRLPAGLWAHRERFPRHALRRASRCRSRATAISVADAAAAIAKVHDGYLAAGADIISTNTFTATPVSQAEYALEADRARDECRSRRARRARPAIAPRRADGKPRARRRRRRADDEAALDVAGSRRSGAPRHRFDADGEAATKNRSSA